MFSKTAVLAVAAASAASAATPQGFNYGSKMGDTARDYNSFKTDFVAQQKLQGAPGTFNSARLYTMLDAKDGASIIPALQAAMDTKTYLLLGLWMSGPDSGMEAEMKAFNQTVDSMPDLAQYILGVSVGSEDLYRISPTGLAAPDAAPGNGPDLIVKYIKEVKGKIAGNDAWSKIPVGHVDTWTAWVNGSNSDVISNSDFLGVDAYPYWQLTEANAVSNGKSLFNEAMDNTKGVSNGKPVWITETGWATTGPTEGQAVAGTNEAKQYWDDVGCPNFGNTPTFWYTLYDGVAAGSTPSFSVADSNYKPLFDLSCSNVQNNTSSSNSTSSSSGSSNGSATGTAASSTGTGSATGSGASNGTYTGAPSQPSSSSSSGSSSGSGSSSSGSSGSGSAPGQGSPSSSSSGAAASGSSISTGAASSLTFSFGTMAALAAGVIALL